jgi:hypothetical protein
MFQAFNGWKFDLAINIAFFHAFGATDDGAHAADFGKDGFGHGVFLSQMMRGGDPSPGAVWRSGDVIGFTLR